MVAPYGVVGQAEQDFQLRGGRIVRLDPVQHGLPQRALDPSVPPQPPRHLPAVSFPAVNPGANPMEALQGQLRVADYSTFANFFARAKKLPRTAASRVDNEKVLQVLRASRLAIDPQLMASVLRALDEFHAGSVAYVKLQTFLNQSWPVQNASPVQNEMLATGPSPDDPHAGAGAAGAGASTFAPAPQRPEDPGMFGTAISYGAPVGRSAPAPPVPPGPGASSSYYQQQAQMQQDMARLQANRRELQAFSGGGAPPPPPPANPFPGAMPLPPVGSGAGLDLNQDIARLRAGAGASTYRPAPASLPEAQWAPPPTQLQHQQQYRSQQPVPASMPPAAQAPELYHQWSGALDPSHQSAQTQAQIALAADREQKARAEERFMFQGQLAANMGVGPGPSAREVQPYGGDNESRGRQRAAGVSTLRQNARQMVGPERPWAQGSPRASPTSGVPGDRSAGVASGHGMPQPLYRQDHLSFTEQGLTGSTAASQEMFGRIYPAHMSGLDTRSALRPDGTIKDHVSRDESRGGITGGGLRHSPTAQHYASDHIGYGMNPEAGGSQALPFAGAYQHLGASTRTQSSFNLDGTLQTHVSLDESNRGVTGGMNRRNGGYSPLPAIGEDSRRPAGTYTNRAANTGLMYGSN